MILSSFALATLLRTCASDVAAPGTMAAFITVESGANPYAIHDNTTRESYAPPTLTEAVAIGDSLVSQGHSVDLGIAQINSGNMATYGVGVANLFNACTNVSVGARILRESWRSAIGRYGNAPDVRPQVVFAAAQGYNSGSLFGAPAYASAVVQAYYSAPVQAVVALSYRAPISYRLPARTRYRAVAYVAARPTIPLREKKPQRAVPSTSQQSFSGVWQR